MQPKDLINTNYIDLKKSGIYMIYCAASNKAYIGQSILLQKRLGEHKSALKANRHKNHLLQRAYNDNKDCLIYVGLENCDEEILTEREIYYVSLLEEEQRFNLAAITRQITSSIEYRQKCSKSQKGRIISKETRRKMSEARKGRIISEEWKKKISEANKGKHNFKHSEESKKKMSDKRTEQYNLKRSN